MIKIKYTACLLSFILILYCINSSIGDSASIVDYPIFRVSQGGKYLLRCIPGSNAADILTGKIDGSFEVLWHITNIVLNGHISYDGKYVVSENGTPGDIVPPDKEIVIQFFSEQGLIKAYTSAELLSDANNVPRSTLTRTILKRQSAQLIVYDFKVNTVEGFTYIFDIRNGNIKSKVKTEASWKEQMIDTTQKSLWDWLFIRK